MKDRDTQFRDMMSLSGLPRLLGPFVPRLLLWIVAVSEGFLLLCNNLHWLPVGQRKGCSALVAFATMAVAVFVVTGWLLLAKFVWRYRVAPWAFPLLLVVVVPSFWLASEVRRAASQREAVDSLIKMGFTVYYSDSEDVGPIWRSPNKQMPSVVNRGWSPASWLHAALGEDFFTDVVRVDNTAPLFDQERVLTDDAMTNLLRLAQLRSLSIDCGALGNHPELTDAAISQVGDLRNLTELTIRNSRKITDHGLRPLRNLPRLERLKLAGVTSLTEAGLASVGVLSGLRELSITNCSLPDTVVTHLNNSTDLRMLTITECPITDEGIKGIERLGNLQVLVLRGTRVGDASMQWIGRLPHLKSLDVSSTSVTNAGMKFVSTMKELREVCVGGTSVGDQGLESLQGIPTLESLDLSDTQVSDAGLACLKEFSRLTRLDLSHTRISDNGVRIVQGFARIELLSLAGTSLTDAGVEHLGGLRQLNQLSLEDTGVGDAGLQHLKRLTKLEVLVLDGTKVTDNARRRFSLLFRDVSFNGPIIWSSQAP